MDRARMPERRPMTGRLRNLRRVAIATGLLIVLTAYTAIIGIMTGEA